MAITPHVVIELDRPRKMTFSAGTVRRLKEATGRGLDVFDIDETDPAAQAEFLGNLGKILWATLAGEDPELTVHYVEEELVHIGNVEYVSGKLRELIEKHGPQAGPLADGPAEKKPAKVKAKAS